MFLSALGVFSGTDLWYNNLTAQTEAKLPAPERILRLFGSGILPLLWLNNLTAQTEAECFQRVARGLTMTGIGTARGSRLSGPATGRLREHCIDKSELVSL